MAEVTTLADVNIAPSQLKRRIRSDAIDHLDRAFEVKQRRDFDQAADRNHREDPDDEDNRVLFEYLMPGPERHFVAPHSAGRRATGIGTGISTTVSASPTRTV